MHKGWHSRGYIPHFDVPDLVQMITFRLADAMPAELVREWRRLYLRPDGTSDETEVRKCAEKYLDAGHGCCCLRDERIATLVQNALLHFDGQRYYLLAWVVMTNHVHILIETREEHPLFKVLHSWKSFTAHRIKPLCEYGERLWQEEEYFDRYIRNGKHFHAAAHYIHENPVKAGLVQCAEGWPFSSAFPGSAGVSPATIA